MRTKSLGGILVFVLFIAMFAAVPVSAAQANVKIYTYVDNGASGYGNKLEGVSVTINGQTKVTDSNGFASLSVTSQQYYTIMASKTGYYTTTMDNVYVPSTGATIPIELKIKVNNAPVIDWIDPASGTISNTQQPFDLKVSDDDSTVQITVRYRSGTSAWSSPIYNSNVAPGTRSFNWNTSSLTRGAQYSLKVTVDDEYNNPVEEIYTYTIQNGGSSGQAPIITVNSPNGGENWSGSRTVTWTASDADGDITGFTVELLKGTSTIVWSRHGLSDSARSTSFLTTQVSDGTNYKFKVTAIDATYRTGSDTSDDIFTIDNPNGGNGDNDKDPEKKGTKKYSGNGGGSSGWGEFTGSVVSDVGGSLILSETDVKVGAGREYELTVSIVNTGNVDTQYKVEIKDAYWGDVFAERSRIFLETGEQAEDIIHIAPDKSARGDYVVVVTLIGDNYNIVSKKIYVEVVSPIHLLPLLIALLIIAIVGVCGLSYFVYKHSWKDIKAMFSRKTKRRYSKKNKK